MKILERYLFWESIKPFFVALIVITFVMMLDRLIDLMNIIIEKQLDILTIVSLFSLSLPFIMALSVPLAVLTSSIMAFGRMSVDMEITAAKACGVNIHKKMIHLYVIAFLLFAGMAYFNDFILPETNHTLKNLMIKVTYRKPINAIKPGTFTILNNISIYAKESKGNELHGIIIFNRENTSFPQTITAETGTIKILNNGNQVKVELYNGEMHERDAKDPAKYQLRLFKKYTMTRDDLGFEMDNSPTNYRGDREMTSKQIKLALIDRKKDIEFADKDIQRLNAELKKLPASKEDPYVLDEYKKINHMLKLKVAERDDMQSQLLNYQVEVQKKYALAFACFVFFIIGAPIGMMTKTSGIGVAFSMSSLIFLTFYVMIVGGEELADRAILSPQIAMWLPNAIFLIFGIILTISSYKEKHIIDLSRISPKIQNLFKRFF